MAISAKIENNKLIITADLETPTPSGSGKSMVHVSSHGNITTTATVGGKPLILGLNVYTRNS